MADYSDKFTNIKLAELELQISRIYEDARYDLNITWKQYINGWDEVVTKKDGTIKVIHHKGLAERYAEEEEAYERGEYTYEEFKAWVEAQVGRGERWKACRDDMTNRLVSADKEAAEIINKKTPEIFCTNYNYSAYTIEKAFEGHPNGLNVSFNLIDKHTAQRLMSGPQKMLPKKKVSVPKDKQWNMKKIQGALLQGILQGDDINKIAKRFEQVAHMDEVSAIRNARTTVTGAQNAGRIASFQDAEEMGIKLEMEWISTFDDRTRESHVHLNGVRVPNGEKWPNGLRWPGDPLGSPEEVYNCRCTVRAILPDINDEARTGNTVESYNEWVEFKTNKSYTKFTGARITDPDSEEAEAFARQYYPAIRKFKTDAIKIAKHTGKSESDIIKVKNYLFIDKSYYNEVSGEYERFAPDCAIAQSWQRLMDGKNIRPHDLTLINHELLEMKIKEDNPDISHTKAHEMASELYDYPKEVDEYYDNIGKHK